MREGAKDIATSVIPAKAGIYLRPDRKRKGGEMDPRVREDDEVMAGLKVRFAGYAAVFDKVDRGGDVVKAGAFAASLKRARKSLPLLWQHGADKVIGRIDYAREDKRGLRVIGEISTATRAGREAAALLKERAMDGLSFGYRVCDAKGERPRVLHELDLVEVSLVTFPMQKLARVHAVEG